MKGNLELVYTGQTARATSCFPIAGISLSMSPSHLRSFIVINKDEGIEHVFATILEARVKLVELCSLGFAAYMYTTRML